MARSKRKQPSRATKKKPSVVVADDDDDDGDDDLDELFVPKRRRKAAGLPRPGAATKRKKKAAAPGSALGAKVAVPSFNAARLPCRLLEKWKNGKVEKRGTTPNKCNTQQNDTKRP